MVQQRLNDKQNLKLTGKRRYMRISFLFILILCSNIVFGQDAKNAEDTDVAYTRTITSRAEKIVSTLNISDSSKAKQAISIITNQYRDLNTIYTERDNQLKKIKQQGLTKKETDTAIKKIEAAVNNKITGLHTSFIAKLSSQLTPDQVIKVKDGMTYNVLNVTYTAYVDMIPSLTKEQKDQIMAWLVEAREYAMDGESSEKKHWWFGKYKGRINNYLSSQGYNITKEREEWEKRLKQKQEEKNQNQS
jgi:hypothetical protein